MEHRKHRRLDKLVLGVELPEVHELKDRPYRVLGPRHRILFHDNESNLILGLLFGPKAALSGVLHDLADRGSGKWRRRGSTRKSRKK